MKGAKKKKAEKFGYLLKQSWAVSKGLLCCTDNNNNNNVGSKPGKTTWTPKIHVENQDQAAHFGKDESRWRRSDRLWPLREMSYTKQGELVSPDWSAAGLMFTECGARYRAVLQGLWPRCERWALAALGEAPPPSCWTFSACCRRKPGSSCLWWPGEHNTNTRENILETTERNEARQLPELLQATGQVDHDGLSFRPLCHVATLSCLHSRSSSISLKMSSLGHTWSTETQEATRGSWRSRASSDKHTRVWISLVDLEYSSTVLHISWIVVTVSLYRDWWAVTREFPLFLTHPFCLFSSLFVLFYMSFVHWRILPRNTVFILCFCNTVLQCRFVTNVSIKDLNLKKKSPDWPCSLKSNSWFYLP